MIVRQGGPGGPPRGGAGFAISAQSRSRPGRACGTSGARVAGPHGSPHRSLALPALAPAAPDPAAASRSWASICVDCHGKGKPKGGVSVARLLDQPTPDGVAAGWEHWLAIADRLETRQMPPEDADAFPTDAQRAEAVSWIRAAFDSYDAQTRGRAGTRHGAAPDERRVCVRDP